MLIRSACSGDVDALIGFRMRLVDSYGIGIQSNQYQQFPGQIRARLEDLLGRGTHHFFVAEECGELVGCICASLELSLPGPTWPGVCGVITDMWVEERCRGRGAARALVEAACQWVRDNGGEKVRLHSTPMAVAVYQRFGFHVAEPAPADVFTTMWLDFPRR